MKIFRVAIFAAIISVCAGCTFTVPQLKAINEAIAGIGSDTQSKLESQSNGIYKWSMLVGMEGRLGFPVLHDDFFVFVSETADAVVFDGWEIRSVKGFSNKQTKKILIDGEKKKFVAENKVSATECSEWTNIPSDSGGIIWTQICNQQLRPNLITVDNLGAVTEINMVVDAEGTRCLIKRLPAHL